MFGSSGNGNSNHQKNKGNYRQVSTLDEFSDDDSDHDDLTPPSRQVSSHGGVPRLSAGGGGNSGAPLPSSSSSIATASSSSYATPGGGGGRHSQPPQHELLLRKQDEGLEMLSQSAERLGAMSLQINDEITFQNQLLDEMETDLERADEDLDLVTRQTKKFIEMSGGQKNCIIIVALAIVAIVLLLVLLYF